MKQDQRVVAVEPPKACTVLVDGEWWPGRLDAWRRTPDGWMGFVWVHVWETVTVARLGPRSVPLTYIRWVPADQLRERDGGVLDVEAWGRHA